MNIRLQYGREGIDVQLPDCGVTVLEPTYTPGLPDEHESFIRAARAPTGSRPLRDCISASDTLAVLVPDITRPFPSDRILPWLFEELGHVPADRFTIVIGTGSHRANTAEELDAMLGEQVVSRYRVVNHNASRPETMLTAGHIHDGHPIMLSRSYVEADKRIVMGFIEPHFMAGFSGGYKGVFPAVADIASIMHYHRAEVIGDTRSTWGVTDANPTQDLVRECGSLLPVDFLVNVALNRDRRISGFFCGDVLEAHARGCRFVKDSAMVACDRPFPVVITTNGGYPLDQNLYQAVKGMSAGAQIVEDGGLIVTAARCNDGFPSHGNFRKLLFDHASPRELLETVLQPGFSMYDQWEAQLLAMLLQKARIALYSEIDPAQVRKAYMEPVDDLNAFVRKEAAGAEIAVLPEGPMTIPYLAAQLGSRVRP